jgi:hypothetical protein
MITSSTCSRRSPSDDAGEPLIYIYVIGNEQDEERMLLQYEAGRWTCLHIANNNMHMHLWQTLADARAHRWPGMQREHDGMLDRLFCSLDFCITIQQANTKTRHSSPLVVTNACTGAGLRT